jgi:hypothetical protein
VPSLFSETQIIMSQSNTITPSQEANKLFHDKRRALTTTQAAQFFWTRRFSQAEREKLGEDFHDAIQKHRNAVKMWAIVKHVNLSLATIEAAESFGILSDEDGDRLQKVKAVR